MLKLSVTFLWFHKGELASYITLLSDRITLEGDLQHFFRAKDILYRSLPSLKIGRLCVNDQFQRKGLGRLMILFAIEKAKEIAKDKAGCRFVTVDPKVKSVGFYQKMGFEQLEKNGAVTLYFDIVKS